MNKFLYLKVNNKRILIARKICILLCLIMALLSSMILAFYHSTNVIMLYYIGYTVLQLSIFFFVSVIICASAFDKLSN